jgi:hypothetical protein
MASCSSSVSRSLSRGLRGTWSSDVDRRLKVWHIAIYECFPPSEGAPALPKNQTPPLTLFLLVILMIVKEASYLSLQRRCLLQIPDCTGAVEELALELRGNSIPAHKHGRAQALQNLLLFLNKSSTVVVILSPLGRLIDMDCHPFFVFGKRCVGLLEIAEFPRFLRRTRCVGEETP